MKLMSFVVNFFIWPSSIFLGILVSSLTPFYAQANQSPDVHVRLFSTVNITSGFIANGTHLASGVVYGTSLRSGMIIQIDNSINNNFGSVKTIRGINGNQLKLKIVSADGSRAGTNGDGVMYFPENNTSYNFDIVSAGDQTLNADIWGITVSVWPDN